MYDEWVLSLTGPKCLVRMRQAAPSALIFAWPAKVARTGIARSVRDALRATGSLYASRAICSCRTSTSSSPCRRKLHRSSSGKKGGLWPDVQSVLGNGDDHHGQCQAALVTDRNDQSAAHSGVGADASSSGRSAVRKARRSPSSVYSVSDTSLHAPSPSTPSSAARS